MAFVFVTLFFWFSAALAADPPPSAGGRVDDAIVLDLTEDGLDQLAPFVEAAVPSPIEPGDLSTTLAIPLFGNLTIDVVNLSIDVAVDEVVVTPRPNGVLDLDIETTVSVNSQNAPARVIASFGGFGCNFYIQPFPVTGSTSAQFLLVDDPDGIDFDRDGQPDTKELDVIVGPVVVTDGATGSLIQTPGCVLTPINNLLSSIGLNLFDVILDQVRPELLSAVEDLPAQLEPLLEEPFRGLAVAEEINLLGVPLFVALWPDSIVVNRDGIRVGLASFADAPRDPCIDRYGIDDYIASSAPLPRAPYPESPFPGPHVVGFAEDDFANLALWSAWSGGLLCLDLGDPDNTFDLGLALDTSLLDIVAPAGTFEHLFEETAPLSVVTDPKAPPVVDLSGPDDVTILVDPVGFVIEAEVAGRRSRVLDVEVTARLGAALDFDGQSGDIVLGLSDIGPETIEVAVAHNDFAPDTNENVANKVRGLLVDIAGPVLDEQLANASLSLALPSFEGFGLQRLETAASASDGSVLGAYGDVGPVPYLGAGCTDGGGCDQGCASYGLPTGTTLGLIGALGLVILRRRDHR